MTALVLAFAALTATLQTPPPLLSRAAVFADRAYSSVQLSPSGALVGWLAPVAGGMELRAARTRAGGPLTVTRSVPAPVVAWQWSPSDEVLLTVRRVDGRDQLARHAPDGSAEILLAAATIRFVARGVDAPGALILALRDAAPHPDGIVRFDVTTRRAELVPGMTGAAAGFFDGRLRLIARQRYTPLSAIYEVRGSTGEWVRLTEVDALDLASSGVVSVARDGSRVFYTSNEQSDTTKLIEYVVATGERRVRAHDPGADVLRLGATVSPEDGTVESVVSYHVRMIRHVVRAPLLDDFNRIEAAGSGDVSIAGQSLDNQTWLLRYLDGGPARYAIYDRRTRDVRSLFSELPSLDGVPLAARHALTPRARDGLSLNADLYLPAGSDRDRNGVPDAPLPTVIFVHGGPWLGFEWNVWEVNRHFQLLANRGYAVIRAGFRGEVGFGKAFVDRGDREWAGAMLTDIIDTATFAVKNGIADPERVGIFGWSFGGTATALALSDAPGIFKCGIALYGVYDFPALLETPFASNDVWRRRVGDVRDPADRRRLTAESPLTRAGAMKVPLLLTHGGQDDRVAIAQSDAYASALASLDAPVSYVVFPAEGHDYMDAGTWRAFWAIGEPFLADRLGGRVEPAGDDVTRANLEIRLDAASRFRK